MDSQNIENSCENTHNKTKLKFHVNCSYFDNGLNKKSFWVFLKISVDKISRQKQLWGLSVLKCSNNYEIQLKFAVFMAILLCALTREFSIFWEYI